MLIQTAYLYVGITLQVVIGIFTLFGKKKKDEKEGETKGIAPVEKSQSSFVQDNTSMNGPGGSNATESGNQYSFPGEEDTLGKLLRSLMQDIPAPSSPELDENRSGPKSTPDFVPPRANPPSRPMVIMPGKKVLEPLMPPEPTPSMNTARPVEAPSSVAPKRPESQPMPVVKPPDAVEEGPKKPAKPERVEKEAKPEPPRTPDRKAGQGFEHVFELTQGAFSMPNLVAVIGPESSGKSTFCKGLATIFLQQGTPCLFVAYEESPSALREGLKKIGCDVAQFEASFRLLVVDGFSGQSDSMSFEPYSIEKPFDLDNVSDVLLRNCQVFLGEKVCVIFDSLTMFGSRTSTKDFVNKFREVVKKLKDAGAVLVATIDPGGSSKDLASELEGLAECVMTLEKEGTEGGKLKVRKLNGSNQKTNPEPFEFDSSKGLVFVQ